MNSKNDKPASTSPLEDAVEDALSSLLESDMIPPETINVFYTAEEWKLIEAFYCLRVENGKLRQSKDRYPLIRLKMFGVYVNLQPEPMELPTTTQ